jgi:hypothetical protein
MLKAVAVLVVVCWCNLADVSPVRASRRLVYWAPNGRFRAVVVEYQPLGYGNGESRMEISDRRGRLLGAQDYSDGGTQGYRLEKGAWTADSRFFVFSTESAGGHQPWHHPTHFYDRRSRRFGFLDGLIDGPGVEDGSFRLKPLARVTVRVLGRRWATFDLRRLNRSRLRKAWVAENQLQQALKKERGNR